MDLASKICVNFFVKKFSYKEKFFSRNYLNEKFFAKIFHGNFFFFFHEIFFVWVLRKIFSRKFLRKNYFVNFFVRISRNIFSRKFCAKIFAQIKNSRNFAKFHGKILKIKYSLFKAIWKIIKIFIHFVRFISDIIIDLKCLKITIKIKLNGL